jgi:hypothetical protein
MAAVPLRRRPHVCQDLVGNRRGDLVARDDAARGGLSCARVMVNMSDTIAVTRTISALIGSATAAVGQSVALNGGVGKSLWPAGPGSVVPLVAGSAGSPPPRC